MRSWIGNILFSFSLVVEENRINIRKFHLKYRENTTYKVTVLSFLAFVWHIKE